jgi:hypothetical protein
MVAGGVTHGGRINGNSGVVDFGRRGAAHSAGGISVRIGSDHRESGGVTRATIDPMATYFGPLNSAHEIAQAVNNPEYKVNPAYREQVAAALAQLEPTNRPKF